ncbi:hypothetical protein GY45DRAFT_560709 [Cubamyces sp. BRFM 1775]|nr:hypothetical protein GY45DRAFT_560709 [Cubamyces sp. BRFM 1775]
MATPASRPARATARPICRDPCLNCQVSRKKCDSIKPCKRCAERGKHCEPGRRNGRSRLYVMPSQVGLPNYVDLSPNLSMMHAMSGGIPTHYLYRSDAASGPSAASFPPDLFDGPPVSYVDLNNGHYQAYGQANADNSESELESKQCIPNPPQYGGYPEPSTQFRL